MKIKHLLKSKHLIGISLLLFFLSCRTPQPSIRKTLADLGEIQNTFRYVAEKVLPVVVEIEVVEIRRQIIPNTENNEDSPFFPWNFGPSDPEEIPEDREFRNPGLGSGVIVKKAGNKNYVLTNNHVIGEADEIIITLHDGRKYTASLVGRDYRQDIALIVFEAEDDKIPVAVLGDSDKVHIGDWVLAVGNPYGLDFTVTAGIVSAKDRKGPTEISNYIQTDAAINQGNSGGALVNLKGELIGINTWIQTPTGGNIGLGFSIPVNNVKRIIEDFIEYGEARYGWLGVSIAVPSSSLAEEFDLIGKKGAFVYHIFLDSPAEVGGILPGDFIVSVGDKAIGSPDELIRIVGYLEPGKETEFRLLRSGKAITVKATIASRENRESIREMNEKLWPGITVLALTKDVKERIRLPAQQSGVLIHEVVDKTKADKAGILPGDVIIKINENEIKNIMDFYKVINNKKIREFSFVCYREGERFTANILK
ncbi:MAG: serine protease [Spirochaetes bacterium]|nr:MAG: serine protease [Spirochaetota bacterium]